MMPLNDNSFFLMHPVLNGGQKVHSIESEHYKPRCVHEYHINYKLKYQKQKNVPLNMISKAIETI